MTRRIEHEDRVLLHVLNEQAESLLAPTDCLGRLSLLRQVPGHFGEADQFPVVVAEGSDQYTGPEACSILPDTPTFILDLAFHKGDIPQASWFPRRHIIDRIEDREVPPDDLVGRVAFEALGSRVPAQDLASGIEHDEGVLLDSGNKEIMELCRGPIATAPCRCDRLAWLGSHASRFSMVARSKPRSKRVRLSAAQESTQEMRFPLAGKHNVGVMGERGGLGAIGRCLGLVVGIDVGPVVRADRAGLLHHAASRPAHGSEFATVPWQSRS